MRVLFYSTIFPRAHSPNRGIYCFNLCRALVGMGHQVTAVSPRSWLERGVGGSGVGPPDGAQGVRIEYPKYFYPPAVARPTYDWFMWASTRGTVRRVMSEFRPDFVLSYWAHPDGAVAVRAAHEFGVPGGFMVGGSDVLVLAQQSGWRRRSIARAIQSADAVIAVSRHLREAVIGLGASEERVHVIHQGVDRDLFRPGSQVDARARLNIQPTGAMLLFVGNLVPVKGLEVLLAACKQLASRGVDFHLYLLGEGASRATHEGWASANGLGDRVTFVGAVRQRDLPDWYRSANLTVLSSHSEGIPNVLRESVACGTPFVATNVGGISEIATDPVNRLVPKGDSAALADAIERSLAAGVRCSPNAGGGWSDSAGRLIEVMKSAGAAAPEFPVPAGGAAGVPGGDCEPSVPPVGMTAMVAAGSSERGGSQR